MFFPFAAMHPNAGARLRAKISYLPNSLYSPNATFGDAILHDQYSSPLTTNALPSSSSEGTDTGRKSGLNQAENGTGMPSTNSYHMLEENDTRGADHPRTDTTSALGSAPPASSPPRTPRESTRQPLTSAGRSSTAMPSGSLSALSSTVPQSDPAADAFPTLANSSSGSSKLYKPKILFSKEAC